MLVKEERGNIILASTDAIVNTVNCVGVMGKGLALQFKHAFPSNFNSYYRACSNKELKPGVCHIFDTGGIKPKYIINFPTKRHWRDNSILEDISIGLDDLVYKITANKISSISIPPLGCGLGGLDWHTVKSLIISKLEHLPITLFLYCPK